jgi:hypothetical protein
MSGNRLKNVELGCGSSIAECQITRCGAKNYFSFSFDGDSYQMIGAKKVKLAVQTDRNKHTHEVAVGMFISELLEIWVG